MEPVSNYILLAHIAEARDHDTARADGECPGSSEGQRAPSDERRGAGAAGVCGTAPWRAPLAGPSMCSRNCTKPSRHPCRQTAAAHQAVTQAEETLNRVQERLDTTNGQPAKRGPGRPPKAAVSLEQGRQDVEAARREHQRLAGQRETGTQSIRAMGHAYHFVDVERGTS